MLKRDEYLLIIDNIRNVEKASLDEFIIKELIPLKKDNDFFIETLYKDINYILTDLDKPGDNDLAEENGDWVEEDGDLKLTGYQTRLHDILLWLHMEMVEKMTSSAEYPNQFIEKMENFEERFLNKQNYTPEYKIKLDIIKQSLKSERHQNTGGKISWFRRLLALDNLELKPNIAGFGINLKEVIKKFKK